MEVSPKALVGPGAHRVAAGLVQVRLGVGILNGGTWFGFGKEEEKERDKFNQKVKICGTMQLVSDGFDTTVMKLM